jgi:sugar diacid utilization regulator
MMFEFAELFPRIRFIRYQQRIIAINQFFSRDIDQQLELIASHLEVFLKKYDAQCGISPVYSELDETRYAFRQTSLSLKYAHLPADSRLGRHPGSSEQKRIHFFEEKYIFCLLGENDENAVLWYHSDGHRLLKKLHQYDKRQKSNNIQLLYEFLSNERNATLAANELNMHRNNVTYHINRIQELLGIDLNDRYHRFLLMVSFYLLELYGFAD